MDLLYSVVYNSVSFLFLSQIAPALAIVSSFWQASVSFGVPPSFYDHLYFLAPQCAPGSSIWWFACPDPEITVFFKHLWFLLPEKGV